MYIVTDNAAYIVGFCSSKKCVHFVHYLSVGTSNDHHGNQHCRHFPQLNVTDNLLFREEQMFRNSSI